jgi:hypothetical protein
MSTIKDEIAAFEQMQSKLEAEHFGRWVLIHDRELVRVYESFEGAANDAVDRFGSDPFLIRQVGAAPVTLPVSVMYHRPNAER